MPAGGTLLPQLWVAVVIQLSSAAGGGAALGWVKGEYVGDREPSGSALLDAKVRGEVGLRMVLG